MYVVILFILSVFSRNDCLLDWHNYWNVKFNVKLTLCLCFHNSFVSDGKNTSYCSLERQMWKVFEGIDFEPPENACINWHECMHVICRNAFNCFIYYYDQSLHFHCRSMFLNNEIFVSCFYSTIKRSMFLDFVILLCRLYNWRRHFILTGFIYCLYKWSLVFMSVKCVVLINFLSDELSHMS